MSTEQCWFLLGALSKKKLLQFNYYVNLSLNIQKLRYGFVSISYFAYLPKNNVHNNHLSKFLASSKPLCIASLNTMYQECGSLFQQASAAVSKENNQLLCKEMDHSKVLSMALNPSF